MSFSLVISLHLRLACRLQLVAVSVWARLRGLEVKTFARQFHATDIQTHHLHTRPGLSDKDPKQTCFHSQSAFHLLTRPPPLITSDHKPHISRTIATVSLSFPANTVIPAPPKTTSSYMVPRPVISQKDKDRGQKREYFVGRSPWFLCLSVHAVGGGLKSRCCRRRWWRYFAALVLASSASPPPPLLLPLGLSSRVCPLLV